MTLRDPFGRTAPFITEWFYNNNTFNPKNLKPNTAIQFKAIKSQEDLSSYCNDNAWIKALVLNCCLDCLTLVYVSGVNSLQFLNINNTDLDNGLYAIASYVNWDK